MKKYLIFGAGFLIVISVLIKRETQNYETNLNYLLENGCFTYGRVYMILPSFPRPDEIIYKYLVEGKEYKFHLRYINTRFFPQVVSDIFWNAKVGEQYLVCYDPDNPENSIILLQYRIKEPGDFERYMERINGRYDP